MKKDIETAKVIKEKLFIINLSFILILLTKKKLFLIITKVEKTNKNEYKSVTISAITLLD